MREEKKLISQEYVGRLNKSPFFIVVDYTGLKVGPIMTLRKRLLKAGAEMHVVKNSVFRIAAKEAGVPDLGALTHDEFRCAINKAIKGDKSLLFDDKIAVPYDPYESGYP